MSKEVFVILLGRIFTIAIDFLTTDSKVSFSKSNKEVS
jgi:hypothetical protein